ncbi:MAG: HD domain-containing phosphohydrolase [Thermodesulfobacteriota bacterium]
MKSIADKHNTLWNDEGIERIIGFGDTLLIKDLFEIMNEVLANRDLSTYKHTLRVAQIAVAVGKEAGLSTEELTILELGCLVHDFGKTAIPDDVLLKPDLFNDQDRRIMEYHPLIGAKLFAPRLHDDRITNIILKHHERLDGSGYPQGLLANDIDYLSRITAVADEFEALVSKRPYKTSFSVSTALGILQYEAEKGALDTTIVRNLHCIAHSLTLEKADMYPTGKFMDEIEHYRRDTFFRDTLSELYNYRYLLVLDDLNVLGEKNTAGYLLLLVGFSDMGRFQMDNGVIVAGQVHDEIGQRLKDSVHNYREKRLNYDGSVMLFRKHCDYMIYAEGDSEEDVEEFIDHLRTQMSNTRDEWKIEANCYHIWFPSTTSIENAMTRLFSLQVQDIESCRTSNLKK